MLPNEYKNLNRHIATQKLLNKILIVSIQQRINSAGIFFYFRCVLFNDIRYVIELSLIEYRSIQFLLSAL